MSKKATDIFSSNKIYFIFIVTTLLITISGIFIDNLSTRLSSENALYFTSGWTVTVDHNVPSLVDLNDYSFDCKAYKTNISLKNTIPDGISKFSTICFPINLSAVDVYISNKLVYSYGSELYNSRRMIGSGLHYITLPTSCFGENVLIVIRPCDDNAFKKLNQIQIIDTNDVYSHYIMQQISRFFISIFLFIFGLILIVAGIALSIYTKRINELIYIGILSVSIGLWTLTSSKVNQIIQPDFTINTVLEYMSLYFAPFAFLLYITSVYNSFGKKMKVYFIICTFIIGAFNLIMPILHFTNTVHYSSALYVFYLLCLPIVPFIFIITFKPSNISDERRQIFKIGSIIILISSLLDMIRHLIQASNLSFTKYDIGSLLPYGTFFFMVTLIIGYDIQIYRSISVEFEKKTFEKLAYTDSLTNLGNRAKADIDIMSYEKEHEEYVIISFDLNGLKQVNDTYGHDFGDKLLISFASILNQAFGEFGTIYRFGGDEFMVLLSDKFFDKIPYCITNMIYLEEKNSSDLPFEIDTSFGIARSKELSANDSFSVYKLADSRMYDMKIANNKSRH